MYQPEITKTRSIAFNLRKHPFQVDTEPVLLSWSPDGQVTLELLNPIDTQVKTQLFSVQAGEIKDSLIANASTMVRLKVDDTAYLLEMPPSNAGETNNGLIAFITMSAVARQNGTYDFQQFLKQHGVKTHRSSMLRIILTTVIVFIIALVILIIYIYNTLVK